MADNTPRFFVPHATPEQQESVYSDLAKWCGASVPPPSERIYSIAFRHDGEDWRATVGEQLRGERIDRGRKRGRQIERRHMLGDSATVLAIFPGNPYKVVTNHRLSMGAPDVGSRWNNPIYVGRPYSVALFGG